QFCFLLFRMEFKPGARQFIVPGPVVFTVRGSMDAYPSATPADIVLKRLFFFRAQHLAGRTQKNNGCKFFQVLFIKSQGIICNNHIKTMGSAQFLNRFNAKRNTGMMVTIGFCVNEYGWIFSYGMRRS